MVVEDSAELLELEQPRPRVLRRVLKLTAGAEQSRVIAVRKQGRDRFGDEGVGDEQMVRGKHKTRCGVRGIPYRWSWSTTLLRSCCMANSVRIESELSRAECSSAIESPSMPVDWLGGGVNLVGKYKQTMQRPETKGSESPFSTSGWEMLRRYCWSKLR